MAYEQSQIRSTLLKVFSGNRLSNISNAVIASAFAGGQPLTGEAAQKMVESLTCEPLYLNLKSQLTEFKDMIEQELSEPNIFTTEQEVKVILYGVVLNRAISFAADKSPDHYDYKMKLLYDLIHQSFIEPGPAGSRWDQRLADHFAYVYPVLQNWYSFFFSYTNKEAFDINKRFESILSLTSVSRSSNQVARFVAERLATQLPKAFIDEKEIEYGDKFQQAIDKAIRNSYTFVQVISTESFLKIGDRNWCQYEFNKYREFLNETGAEKQHYYENALRHNFFFLVMGPDLKSVSPALVLAEFRGWHREIQGTHYIKFYTTQTDPARPGWVQNDYNSFRDALDKLIGAILQAKKRLIDAIPAAPGLVQPGNMAYLDGGGALAAPLPGPPQL